MSLNPPESQLMARSNQTEAFLADIAKRVHSQVFANMRPQAIDVLLMGAGRSHRASIRGPLRKQLEQKRFTLWVNVYYPEAMFSTLLAQGSKYDLLSLEKLVARSAHAVVLILDGPGVVAELGVFSASEELRSKLVVIVDKRHERSRSFIMLGPIRLLRQSNPRRVLFDSLRSPDMKRLTQKVLSCIREVSQDAKTDYSLSNPIVAQDFLRSAIYVMEPLTAGQLRAATQPLAQPEGHGSEEILTASMDMLKNQKELKRHNGCYYLTKEGLAALQSRLRFEPNRRRILDTLDELRIEVLNFTCRHGRRL